MILDKNNILLRKLDKTLLLSYRSSMPCSSSNHKSKEHMYAGDEAFTLGKWPEKGVSKCAGRPLLGNFLCGRPFHQMSKYSALRFPSHSRRQGVGREVEL